MLDSVCSALILSCIGGLYVTGLPTCNSHTALKGVIVHSDSLGSDAMAAFVTAQLPSLGVLDGSDDSVEAAAIRHLAKGTLPELVHIDPAANALNDILPLHVGHGSRVLRVDGDDITHTPRIERCTAQLDYRRRTLSSIQYVGLIHTGHHVSV